MVRRAKVTQVLGSLVLCLAVSVASPSARAEEGGKATALAQAAEARSRQGDLRVAIDLYDEAYALSPRPEYLRAAGKIYDELARAGDSRDVRLAILYYERSIAVDGDSPERAEVEARLARLRGWKARMRADPQAPPPPAMVPLHFLAYKPDAKYEVWSGAASCTTPCTLAVPPGPAAFKATGTGLLEMEIVVPPRPSQLRIWHTDSHSVVAGAVMIPVGALMGVGMWALAFTCDNQNNTCVIANLTVWPILGASTLIAGIVLLARGRSTPPADANRIELVGRASPVQLTSFGLAPLVGGGGAGGLRFSF
jgi:hypothetical protein